MSIFFVAGILLIILALATLMGALSRFTEKNERFAVIFFLLGIIVTAIFGVYRQKDSYVKVERSYTVITDSATGCEYIKVSTGVTPRMDSTGKQVCK
jgi:uncharacterized membrane protein